MQIMLLLTLALLPLGAIAIYQTNRVAAEAEENANLALLAITARTAKSEELIIERAFGAARLLGATAGELMFDTARCEILLGALVESEDRFSFAGIIPPSGFMTCSSNGRTFDFAGQPGLARILEEQTPIIVVNREGPMSGRSVFIVSQPFFDDGALAGFVSISIPNAGLPETPDEVTQLGLEALMTFNTEGQVLTARGNIDDEISELPGGRELEDIQPRENKAFFAQNREGEWRTYTVVPIENSPATVIGVWRTDRGLAQQVGGESVKPWLFPVLMWLASMCVALLSVYSLVLRHISALRRRMSAFTMNRHVDFDYDAGAMPNELLSLSNHFDHMTDNILRDEASLEDAVHEKNVLIKEVHHRVKNNLQLISSIMNMQIRTARHEETRSVLKRLQDRVLSLATIHRDLYQSQHGGMVDVGTLVTEVIEGSLEVAMDAEDEVQLEKDIDPVLLYPDQAVPLSLLVAEATTNAMKYLGSAHGARPAISVSLKQVDMQCTVRIVNSLGAAKEVESTGLGSQLMKAFAIQLGGRIHTDETPEQFTMTVEFTVADFIPEGRDF